MFPSFDRTKEDFICFMLQTPPKKSPVFIALKLMFSEKAIKQSPILIYSLKRQKKHQIFFLIFWPSHKASTLAAIDKFV